MKSQNLPRKFFQNAPMRFFYIITRHEQSLEAPPNNPSTPGLGATFPPSEDTKQDKKEDKDVIEKPPKRKIHKEETTQVKNAETQEKAKKVIPKPDSPKPTIETKEEPEKKNVKTPIKILKNSNGSYEVLKSTKPSPESTNAKFSVVSVDDGKIKLKQCTSAKPKIISNVEFRNSVDKKLPLPKVEEKVEKKPDEPKDKPNVAKSKKEDKEEKLDKIKRKVTFVEESPESGKKLEEVPEIKHPDKKEFLQTFELTANENGKSPSETSKKASDTPKADGAKSKLEDKPLASILKEGTSEKSPKATGKPSKPSSSPQKALVNTNSTNVDVYTFPSEPPSILPGAIKRKCPPGLMITDVPASKKMALPIQKKPVPSLLNTAKSYRKMMKEPNRPSPDNTTKTPMSASETRSLLDECGLNIPAGLSITLTSPRPSTNPYFDGSLSKDAPMDKVSPNISLNNKSLDPQVLKAFKMGQVKSPVAGTSDRSPKKKEQEILDLSAAKLPLPRIKIPQPPSKLKPPKQPGPRKLPQQQMGQVVTLMGGQKYYRAPPGSLTPAAHRYSDYLGPSTGRGPVYAPSPFSSPPTSSGVNAFSKMDSLYVLNQSPTLQQFQMDKFKMMHQEAPPSGRSHLAAQCAPIKPPRSSQTSLAVPIPRQGMSGGNVTIKKLLAVEPKVEAKSSSSSSEQNSSRVSSTVSPSPPPAAELSEKPSNEVIKSPESPDSSSAVQEVKAMEKGKEEKKEKNSVFQERLLAAFPSEEWGRNPKAVKHLGNFLKSLSDEEGKKKEGKEDAAPGIAAVD